MSSENQGSPESFSDDPQENLRIENEILKLTMQAEHGVVFGGQEGLSPEIENEFLQNVQQFEDAWNKAKQIKLYDFIGRPQFKPADELNDEELEAWLNKMTDAMAEKNVFLDTLAEYEVRVIYRFITEELFDHEMDDMQLPGWSHNFIYEEFHPNHKMDIEKTALDFLKDWFKKEFNDYSLEFDETIITDDQKNYSRDEIKEKLNTCLSFYESFANEHYQITEISFNWNDEENKGLGHAEGMVKYEAQIEDGSTIPFEGPFKFYMLNEMSYWNIFYFIMPGFKW